ncbi:MAG: DUF3987 domain-containing protein [Parachlamydiales bacterium]
MATAVQGKYRVKVKPDYFEPVNIWTCVALPPGNHKTAVLGVLTQTLMEWENHQRILLEPVIVKMVIDKRKANWRYLFSSSIGR